MGNRNYLVVENDFITNIVVADPDTFAIPANWVEHDPEAVAKNPPHPTDSSIVHHRHIGDYYELVSHTHKPRGGRGELFPKFNHTTKEWEEDLEKRAAHDTHMATRDIQLSKVEFLKRLTDAELDAIYASNSAHAKKFIDLVINGPDTVEIRNDNRFKNLVKNLRTGNHIAAGRDDELLSTDGL